MSAAPARRSRRFMFVSSNEVWGGSEELWSLAALALARQGHGVSVYKPRIDGSEARLRALAALGCRVTDLRGPGWVPRKARTAASLHWPAGRMLTERTLRAGLRKDRPDLVLISQGLNFDGWHVADICRRAGVPYAIVSQKADDLYWPHDSILEPLRAAYAGARAAMFVSAHNRVLTEQQLGRALPNGEYVFNPFRASWAARDDWPEETGEARFVCLGRLDAREKGQDVLLRVLARPEWRARALHVTFVGAGHNQAGLEGMARYLELDRVAFAGFVEQPERLWTDCHGLILPSRCEGLPLSLVEAMLSGRLAIVTDVGGNAELARDGETAFIARTATEIDLADAIERAWARRDEWRAIARAAARDVRSRLPADPTGRFADRLIALAGGGDRADHIA